MTQWTEAQQRAIYGRERNITVSASAGSGKTTILVERILTRVLQDRVPLDKILAMTFTEAAASEMKKRLFGALNKALLDDVYDKHYIEEQLVLLQRAQISTIHSFCLSIIKENYAMIGFGLNRLSHIIGDDDAAIFQQEAMQLTIDAYINHPQFYPLMQYFSSRPHDQSILKEQIKRLSGALLGMKEESQFQSLLQQTHQARCFRELPPLIRGGYFTFLCDYLYYLEETLDLMAHYDTGEKESKIATKKTLLKGMAESAEEQNYNTFRIHFETFVTMVVATGKDNPYYDTLRKQLHEIEDTMATFLFEEHVLFADLHANAPLIDLLILMAKSYARHYDAIKEQNEVMDFDDMEQKAMALLVVNDHEIAKRYRTRFVDILVDEYQDSSYHQDAMIQLIQNGNNVFRVGDVKQSIYRFRGAVPDLLKSYIQMPGALDEVIHLRHNYRSNSQIITFVNQLFEVLMRLPQFPILFQEEDVANVGMESQYTLAPSIDLHLIQTDAWNDVEEPISNEAVRARYIANLIITDKERNPEGRWSDYVILVRNHSRKQSLKQAFDYANIPNFIDSKEGFYNASIIETMRAFFKVIENPEDNLYVTAICLSCIYEMSDNDLARIKLEANKKSFFSYAKTSSHALLRLMVQDVLSLQQETSLSEMIQKMFAINNFYETKTTKEDRTNLDLLYEKAIQFEKKGQGTLSHFIEFTDALVDSKSSEALSINIEEDVVRVMSIHQSKGLQFPKVIYWGKERTSYNNKPLFYIDSSIGFGMDYLKLSMRLQRPTLLKLMMEHIDKKEEVSEEIRILYVALTRAKDQLFVVTTDTANKLEQVMEFPLTSYQLLQKMNFSHWIVNLSTAFAGSLVTTTLVTETFQPLRLTKEEPPTHRIQRWFSTNQMAATITPSSATQGRLFPWVPGENQASIGTITHRVIQAMDVHHEYREEELMALVAGVDASVAAMFDYRKLLTLQADPLYQACRTMTVFKEMAFTYLNDEYQMIYGYMDMVAMDDHQVIVIDYKTDQHTSQSRLLAEYSDQLGFYKEAMRIQYPNKKITAYLYSLWLSRFVLVEEKE